MNETDQMRYDEFFELSHHALVNRLMEAEDCITANDEHLQEVEALNAELLASLRKVESWRLAALDGSGRHGGKSSCLKDFDEAAAAIAKAQGK